MGSPNSERSATQRGGSCSEKDVHSDLICRARERDNPLRRADATKRPWVHWLLHMLLIMRRGYDSGVTPETASLCNPTALSRTQNWQTRSTIESPSACRSVAEHSWQAGAGGTSAMGRAKGKLSRESLRNRERERTRNKVAALGGTRREEKKEGRKRKRNERNKKQRQKRRGRATTQRRKRKTDTNQTERGKKKAKQIQGKESRSTCG